LYQLLDFLEAFSRTAKWWYFLAQKVAIFWAKHGEAIEAGSNHSSVCGAHKQEAW
jgi:hypothetical protein